MTHTRESPELPGRFNLSSAASTSADEPSPIIPCSQIAVPFLIIVTHTLGIGSLPVPMAANSFRVAISPLVSWSTVVVRATTMKNRTV